MTWEAYRNFWSREPVRVALTFLEALTLAVIFAGVATGFIAVGERLDGVMTTAYERAPEGFWHFFIGLTIVISIFMTLVSRGEGWGGSWLSSLATGLGMGLGMATGFCFGEYVPRIIPYWEIFTAIVAVGAMIAFVPVLLLGFAAWQVEVERWNREGGQESGKPFLLPF